MGNGVALLPAVVADHNRQNKEPTVKIRSTLISETVTTVA